MSFLLYNKPMRVDIITLFPGMFEGPLTESILQRARENDLLQIHFHDLRQFGAGKYKQIDDRPYGGGAGMVMMAEPIVKAIESIESKVTGSQVTGYMLGVDEPATFQPANLQQMKPHRIYFSPRGERLKQTKVEKLAKKDWLILLCGHYEGIDQRIIDGGWIDEEISIGDYVLTGGELPAMVLIDAVSRHIPGVLGKEESAQDESFSKSLGRKKEYPHYTRPEVFRDMKVPDILISGNHAKIDEWRKNNVM
jgi:tRNA (guanine37-N1)-methyltransferase